MFSGVVGLFFVKIERLKRGEKDEINVPIALSALRDKGSRLWSFGKKEKKRRKKVEFRILNRFNTMP